MKKFNKKAATNLEQIILFSILGCFLFVSVFYLIIQIQGNFGTPDAEIQAKYNELNTRIGIEKSNSEILLNGSMQLNPDTSSNDITEYWIVTTWTKLKETIGGIFNGVDSTAKMTGLSFYLINYATTRLNLPPFITVFAILVITVMILLIVFKIGMGRQGIND